MRQAFYCLKQRWPVLVLSFLASVHVSTVWAEQRALIAFNSTEHRVHTVMQNPIPQTNSALAQRRSSFEKSRYMGVAAIATWFDINGNVVKTARFDDPRITHAPLTGASQSPDWLVLTKGAYLLEGPGTAVQLQIDLPMRLSLGLAAENWLLQLSE